MAEGTAATTVIDRSGEQPLRTKISELETDNLKYRRQLKSYKALGTVDEIKQKLPAADAIVITADRAKALEAYEKLGKPEDLAKTVTERDELKGKVAAQEHEESAAAAATAAAYNVKALLKLPGADKLKFEVKKEKVDGEDVEVAYVTDTAKQGSTPQKLTEWVEANHSEFQTALAADAADQPEKKKDSPEFPRQRPAMGGPKKAPTEEEFQRATESTVHYAI